MASPRRVEVEFEEDMEQDEQAVMNSLLQSQKETIRQQRQVIEANKEKIRLLNALVDRRDKELSAATNNDQVAEGLREEVSRLQTELDQPAAGGTTSDATK